MGGRFLLLPSDLLGFLRSESPLRDTEERGKRGEAGERKILLRKRSPRFDVVLKPLHRLDPGVARGPRRPRSSTAPDARRARSRVVRPRARRRGAAVEAPVSGSGRRVLARVPAPPSGPFGFRLVDLRWSRPAPVHLGSASLPTSLRREATETGERSVTPVAWLTCDLQGLVLLAPPGPPRARTHPFQDPGVARAGYAGPLSPPTRHGAAGRPEEGVVPTPATQCLDSGETWRGSGAPGFVFAFAYADRPAVQGLVASGGGGPDPSRAGPSGRHRTPRRRYRGAARAPTAWEPEGRDDDDDDEAGGRCAPSLDPRPRGPALNLPPALHLDLPWPAG